MTSFKATVIVSLLMFSFVPSGLALSTPQYYSTAPTSLHHSQSGNFTQVSIAADSIGNLHSVAVHENGHLFYTLSDPSGSTLISQTQISDSGVKKTNQPVIEIDQSDTAHVIWADHAGQHSIMYTALDAYLTTPFTGQNSTDESLSVINDTILVKRNQNRGQPHFAVDSVDNLHLVWEDRYDDLQQTMATSNVYYKLLNPNIANRSLEILVDDSIIAVSPLESSDPHVVLSSSDVPTVLWQEPSRDHGLEMAFVIDTSGSMYQEWDDVCTIMYGGNFASGGYFQGIKPMFNESGVTIFETIYGLGNTLPGAASSGNCQGHNKNTGPRTTALGQTPGDDSGGIRKLPGTIYNGNTYSGYSGEDWGPGSNWACLSWKDASGNVPGNPPTQSDHRWNPNATKIVIPVSDEGPKDGDPSQQADDKAAIQEAHDNCLLSGVIPVGLYGQGYGGAGNIQSHFMDLVQCPNGIVSTQSRNCPGNTLANTDAGGQAYAFPTTNNGWTLMIESFWWMYNLNSPRDVMMKTIDPYGLMKNDPFWTNGQNGHSISGGEYVEDIGGFVRVQTSSLTNESGISHSISNHVSGELYPQAIMDNHDRLHLSWLQSLTNTNSSSSIEQLQYAVLDVSTNRTDGVPEGLLFNGSRLISAPRTVSNQSWMPVGGTHALVHSQNGDAHIVWKGINASGYYQLFYLKFDPNNSSLSLPSLAHQVTNWTSEKLVLDSRIALTAHPGFSSLAWDDRFDCESMGLGNLSSICHVSFVDKGLNLAFEDEPESPQVFYPGDALSSRLVLDTNAYGTTSLTDEHIRFQYPSVPSSWNLIVQHPSNGSLVENNSELFVEAGSTVYLDMTLTAPTIYTATTSIQFELAFDVEFRDLSNINQRLLLGVSLVVNSSVNVSSNNPNASTVQGGQVAVPMNILSASNVVETAIISWSSSSSDFSSMFDITAPLLEYLGPGEQVNRSINIHVYNNTLPGNYSMMVNVASAYVNPLEVSSFEILIQVLPQFTNHVVYNISSFDPYFQPEECRLLSLVMTKMYSLGELRLDLEGAVDGRFIHDESDWTYDFRSIGVDNAEFRGPWSHSHRQQGPIITLELCSPSVMMNTQSVVLTIVPKWDAYDIELNSQSVKVYPYRESEWQIDADSSRLAERSVNITGSLLNNTRSGDVIFEFALNASILDASSLAKQSMAGIGTYQSVMLSEPGAFEINLNLSTQLDKGVRGFTTVYVMVTDSKSSDKIELIYQYDPMPDGDGDQVPDEQDAFSNIATQWSDTDGDGYGDNWGNVTWNATRQKFQIGEFVFGAVMADYCPEIPGNSTANGFFGCPDDDGDGIPNLFEVAESESDSDNDGIPDESDQCPYTPAGMLIDSMGCELQIDDDDTVSADEDGFLQSEIAQTVGWGAILLAIFTFLQTNAAAAILPDAFRWVQVFRNNTKLSREEENELTYLQSLVQAYYLEPETLAEELREFKADLTARYTNNEVKKITQEKISVLIKDLLSSSGDDLAHIANNDAYFGLVAIVAVEDRIELLSEKLAMESESHQTIFDEMTPPSEAKGEINPKDGLEWIEYPTGSSDWFLRAQPTDAWEKWES